MRRTHLIASLLVSMCLFGAAMPAWAGDTFFVNSASGNDANNCKSASTACLTINQATSLIVAQDKPQNSTLKLSGTFNEAIAFEASDVDNGKVLDGLRITATDQDDKPTINAAGHYYGLYAYKINDLTIDHLIVTGSTVGISVSGYSSTYVDHISIHHNTVSGLDADPDFTGIALLSAKQSKIEYNRVSDISVDDTDASGYTSDEAIYLYQLRNSAVKNNTVRDITIQNSSVASASGRYTYLYGISGSLLSNVVVKENDITRLSNAETTTLANVSHSNLLYGIALSAASALTVNKNELSNLTASSSAAGLDGVSITSQTFGLYIADLRSGAERSTITGNSVEAITASQAADSGAAYSYGIRLEYIYNTLIHNNTVKDMTSTAGATLTGGSYTAYVSGIYGPNFGDQVEISGNNLRALTAETNYSGDDSSSYPTLRGIYANSTGVEVRDNTLRDFSWSVDQQGADGGNDYPVVTGLEASYHDGIAIVDNTLRDFTGTYSASGVGAYLSTNLQGILANTANGVVVRNNLIRDFNFNYEVSDLTNTSYGYQYLIPVYVKTSTDITVAGNTVRDYTASSEGNVGNFLVNYFYGYDFANSDGSVYDNTLKQLTLTNNNDTNSSANYVYGIYTSGLGSIVLDSNTLKGWNISSTSSAATQIVMAIDVTMNQPIYVNANRVRNLNIDSANTQHIYGLALDTDASEARVFNNILLGNADYTAAGSYTGIYLPSDSSKDLDIVNNTASNWRYPLQLEGGSKVLLQNNIFAATSATGHALAIKFDHVDLDHFKSDYNLLHTTEGKANAVYDLDNATSITFSDWTEDNDYEYDRHSRYTKAGLNSQGLLRDSSKAIGHGVNEFTYSAEELAHILIHIDVNGDNRPDSSGAVDIGADQHE